MIFAFVFSFNFLIHLASLLFIGLIDVDIYGPSLPTLVKLDDYKVRRSPLGAGMILPLQHRGVKMISLGFVSPSVSWC